MASSNTSTISSPSPTSSSVINLNDGPLFGTSASLYLYTFLATLILILAISSLVVLRVSVLRHRRREDTMQDGTFRYGDGRSGTGGGKTDVADKPMLYDVCLHHNNMELEMGWEEKEKGKGEMAIGSMPVAVALACSSPPRLPSSSLSSSPSHLWYHHYRPPPTPPHKLGFPPDLESQPGHETSIPDILRIMYLVRMPTLSPKKTTEHEEEDMIPLIEFGIATARMTGSLSSV